MTTSHAMPVKANTGKSAVKIKSCILEKSPRDIIEAIKSGVCLDSNDSVVDLVESRIKSGVCLDSVNSNDGVVNLIVPVNHNY